MIQIKLILFQLLVILKCVHMCDNLHMKTDDLSMSSKT